MQTRSTYYASPPPPSTRTRALGTTAISTTSTPAIRTNRAIQSTTTTARRRHLQVTFVEPVKSDKSSRKKKTVATGPSASTVRKVVKSVVRVGKKVRLKRILSVLDRNANICQLDTQNKLVKKPRSVRRVKGSGKNTISA